MIDKRHVVLPAGFPTIVCLCGSTRFYEEFQYANYTETMAGRIVLTVGHYPNSDGGHGEQIGCTPEQKIALDDLHKRKIELAEEVLVLNPKCRVCPTCKTVWRHDSIRVEKCSCGTEIGGVEPVGYIGSSTRGEIAHAIKCGKKVRSLEPITEETEQ